MDYRLKLTFWIAGILAALALVLPLFTYTATDESSATSRVKRSHGPWTVAGVSLGMTRDEVRAKLGPPARELLDRGRRVDVWTSPVETWVSFETNRQTVVEVTGPTVNETNGVRVVSCGDSEDDLRAALGNGSVSGHYSPSGSGVISLGMKKTGATREYIVGEARFRIGIVEDRVQFIRLDRADAPR